MKIRLKILFWALVVVAFFVLPFFVNLYTDWLWFSSIGFESVFTTTIVAQFAVGSAFGFAAFLLFYGNIALFRLFNKNEPIEKAVQKGQYIENVDVLSGIKRLALPVSLALGALIGFGAFAAWKEVLLFVHGGAFDVVDPIFAKDISFYIFSLPVLKLILNTLTFVLTLSFIVSALLYLVKGALVLKRGIFTPSQLGSNLIDMSREAKMHLFSLITFWFIILGLKIYFVRMPGLLYARGGATFGASYTDVHALLPMLYVLLGVSVLGALLAFFSIWRKGVKPVVFSLALYLAVSFFGLSVYPALLQNFVVKPNELTKESPYIQNHIKATQEAWGLSSIQKRNIEGEASLSIEDIKDNSTTIDNIRLWDRGPLLDTFGQLQEIRTYYDFVSADNDRYVIDGDYRQVLLSSRELNSASLPQRNFINERLTFTHGMGVALSPINEKTEEGLPVLFVKDLPPVSEKDELTIERPEIYFGEVSNDYVIVNTEAKEFDYPSGEDNVYAFYEGDGGVTISSLFKKAVFALKFNTLKMFLSTDITRESKILYHRNIRERVRKALPFLTFDQDPYVVIHEGKIVWMYDAYTTSNAYPYSQRIDGKNYMRNSVKVVIDAYSGKMQAYITDTNDPIIKSFAGIFPGVLKPLSEMPENLRAHIRYPEDIFSYQALLYSIYHMEDSQIFYNKEDLWEVPKITGSNRGENIGPIMRHLIMKLPGEEKEEFVLMLPFTPRGKNNMSAWMAARSDGEHYGELVVYRFPKQSLVFGPKQIVNRINQNPEISRQISLWDQRGSEVIQGNLSVIPINESILYIRPLYLRAEGGKIPELKRVIVAYENQIAMEETLDMALANIFSGLNRTSITKTSQKTSKPTINSQKQLIGKAGVHYNRAQSALTRGDWARYGEEMKKLGEVLRQLR